MKRNEGAILYKEATTNLINLKHALAENEVAFIKNRRPAANNNALRSAIDEGLGNMTFEIKWAKTELKWQ